MVKELDINIDPETVIAEDIEEYYEKTENTIDQIQSEINNKLKNIYDIHHTRFFQETEPDPESFNRLKGVAWFKIQQS